MKIFKIAFLLLSSFYLLFGCASKRYYSLEANLYSNSILGIEYKSMLYKVGVKFYNNYFSGLVLLKKIENDSAVHVVFMTEFGLTLLDLKYKDDVFTVVSNKELFAGEHIVIAMEDSFRCLLQDFSYIDKYKIKALKENNRKLEFSHLLNSFSYFYKSDFVVYEIKKNKKGLFNAIKIKIIRNEDNEPVNILLERSLIDQSINMELIRKKL